jgi:hypothetical protein
MKKLMIAIAPVLSFETNKSTIKLSLSQDDLLIAMFCCSFLLSTIWFAFGFFIIGIDWHYCQLLALFQHQTLNTTTLSRPRPLDRIFVAKKVVSLITC